MEPDAAHPRELHDVAAQKLGPTDAKDQIGRKRPHQRDRVGIVDIADVVERDVVGRGEGFPADGPGDLGGQVGPQREDPAHVRLEVEKRLEAAAAFPDTPDERDPWLSPDGNWLYFATDREGTLDIFVSAVSRE